MTIHYDESVPAGEEAFPSPSAIACDAAYTKQDRAVSDPARVTCPRCIIALAELTLWEVVIDEEDDDYDRFQRCVVWAGDAEHAEEIVRAALRYPDQQDDPIFAGELWISDPAWRLEVRPAPRTGIPLIHWHAG